MSFIAASLTRFPAALDGQLNERMALILDPMFSTAESTIATIDMLKKMVPNTFTD